jgi:spore maturation protein B
MRIALVISDLLIPVVFASILLFGAAKKVPLYDTFITGAKDGVKVVYNIFPTIVGLMVSVGVFRASGALDLLAGLTAPLASAVGFPKEAAPLTLMRLVSSSASTGLLLDTFKNSGADSFVGRFVSIMMSSTETVFYTLSVYFLSVNVTKTRWTLPGALLANFAGVAAALLITRAAFR